MEHLSELYVVLTSLVTLCSVIAIFIGFITLVTVLAKMHSDQETLKEKVKVLFELWNKRG